MLFFMAVSSSFSAIIYVDDDAPLDPGPGNPAISDPNENGTLEHPYDAIQEAIDAAELNDTIIVSQGTYYENLYINTDIILTSTNPQDPNIVESTIIDGKNVYRVITFSGSETSNCLLSGFTITNGYAPEGDFPEYYGGGIYGNFSYVSISHCIISNNSSTIAGGGLAYINGPISNCTITGNIAVRLHSYGYGWGGGLIYCNGAITDCVISDNTAEGTGGAGGGLKWCDGPVTNCTITGNSGGGIAGCSGIITNCTIIYNDGGGIIACPNTIRNCSIMYNSYADGGGLMNCDGTISNCRIMYNNATNNGGGIYGRIGTLSNCRIMYNNAANNGGGIYVYGTCGTIMNCTIAYNSAQAGGGLVGCAGSIRNNILFYNTPDQFSGGNAPAYSCIEGGGGGIGCIDTDPNFVDPLNDDYHLAGGSPCIDAGDPNYIILPGVVDLDMDGQPRVMGGRVDIGADEFPSDSPFFACWPKSFYLVQLPKSW
jgi:hypothetical protein